MCELIEKYGASAVLSEDVRKNKLLVFLLRRGYIDEKYIYYINYFKGSSITNDDMNFILAVKTHTPFEPSYHLEKTSNVVNKLQPYEFEQKEIYNYLAVVIGCRNRLIQFAKFGISSLGIKSLSQYGKIFLFTRMHLTLRLS